mmetsp:Transcript_7045/g.30027  ORF Transcript_7045/g.30027 Transcript_7045/m.30027 type:complete len:271 (+) Transcript_7045:98-910(+)
MCFVVAAHASATSVHFSKRSAAAASASLSSCRTTWPSCRTVFVSRNASDASAKDKEWSPRRAASRARSMTPRQTVSAFNADAREAPPFKKTVSAPHETQRKTSSSSSSILAPLFSFASNASCVATPGHPAVATLHLHSHPVRNRSLSGGSRHRAQRQRNPFVFLRRARRSPRDAYSSTYPRVTSSRFFKGRVARITKRGFLCFLCFSLPRVPSHIRESASSSSSPVRKLATQFGSQAWFARLAAAYAAEPTSVPSFRTTPCRFSRAARTK